MIRLFLFFTVLFSAILLSNSIRCFIGYGQRGLQSKNEISWTRDCPNTKYCWEVVTADIAKVQLLIDYPWNSYYSQFFIKSCGGDLGTDAGAHPYRGKPKSARTTKGAIKFNITTPHVVTGQGGKAEFDLNYICRTDLCSSGATVRSLTAGAMIVMSFATVWLLL